MGTFWQTVSYSFGTYEYEYDEDGYTGWCRSAGGQLADGRWPEHNNITGEDR